MPGLPDAQIGLFVRLHHAVADGMAAMATIGGFLDPAPDAIVGSGPPWTPARFPRRRDLLADNVLRRFHTIANALSAVTRPRTTVRRMAAAWPAIREVFAGKSGPETSLDRVVGPDRNLALVRAA